MKGIVIPDSLYKVLRFMLFAFICATTVPKVAPSAPANREISRIMQERKAVEANLRSLKQQLKEYQSKLNVTTRKESQSFKALENIRRQILVLENMIQQNQNYLEKLDGDIDHLQQELQNNRQTYGKVSNDFRRTAVSVYKYGGNRDIEHLFSSRSMNDALVRAQYMGFFTRAIHHNVNELQQVAGKLESSKVALEQTYQQKAAIVKEQEQQLKSWSASKKEKEVVLGNLKKNKQEYATQLAKVKKKRQQLQSRIESLIIAEQHAIEMEQERQRKIAEERKRIEKIRIEAARKARERREAKRQELQRFEAQRLKKAQDEKQRLEAERLAAQKEKPSQRKSVTEKPKTRKKKTEPIITKPEKRAEPVEETVEAPEPIPEKKSQEEIRTTAETSEIDRVSANFDTAFGSLPWPVRNGVIAQRFGSVEDKDLKIVTTNNGIDFSVPSNTQVRAVSGGKVVQIAFLPTFGNIVIIRHPKSYLTVYANLGQLQVTKGDIITSQQLIGMSGKMAEGGSVVHFEIWKGRVKQNPQKWLRR